MRRRSSLDAVGRWLFALLVEHDLLRKPVPTFRDHALVQSSLRRRVAVPVERLVVGRDHHALGVEMIVEAFGAELAPDAGVIDAAPGRGRVEAVVIVDPDNAGPDRGGEAMGAADVAGAEISPPPCRDWRWSCRR